MLHYKFLIIFICSFLSLFAQEYTVQNAINSSSKGDWAIFSIGQRKVLFYVSEKTDTYILLEEYEKPESIEKTIQKVPNAIYTFPINENEANSLLTTLFTLKFTSIPEKDRKKTGPKPLEGELDLRKIWHPPLYFEGKKHEKKAYCYKSVWPKDNSPLSGRIILIYVPENPTFFFLPYWIEVQDSQWKMHILDSGNNIFKKIDQ